MFFTIHVYQSRVDKIAGKMGGENLIWNYGFNILWGVFKYTFTLRRFNILVINDFERMIQLSKCEIWVHLWRVITTVSRQLYGTDFHWNGYFNIFFRSPWWKISPSLDRLGKLWEIQFYEKRNQLLLDVFEWPGKCDHCSY
jgi:hypothetical protein